jgi:hypothetical protein
MVVKGSEERVAVTCGGQRARIRLALALVRSTGSAVCARRVPRQVRWAWIPVVANHLLWTPMESSAATLHARPWPSSLGARIEPLGVWLFGFLLVALVGGRDGGFFPPAWAWTAFMTWWVAAFAIVLRRRFALGRLDLTMVAGALLFAGWFALSAVWSRSVPSTLGEAFRCLAYAGIVACALLIVQRGTVAHLLGGVTTAITLLSLHALGTRVLPDRFGAFQAVLGYRLSEPIGYWNGLGIFAVIGFSLALGFAARAKRLPTRAAAGAALPILATTTYFTFSRGAWLALAIGLLAAFALDPRRLQLAFATVTLGLAPIAAVALASRADGLTQQAAPYEAAVRDGHHLIPILAVLMVAGAAAALLLGILEARVEVPSALRLGWAAGLAAVALVGLGGVWLQEGSPPALFHRAWSQVRASPTAIENTDRIFDLSSNGRLNLWQVAWDTFEEHPLHGVGGGTYWQVWVENPLGWFASLEAHNVYAETLSELGIVGLALLMVLLVPPFVGAARARRSPLVPFALAAYAAWVVHTGVDWDWELVGVSGAALLCGVALVAAGRGPRRALSVVMRGGVLAVAASLMLVALASVAATARLDSASSALRDGDLDTAVAEARRAGRYAPWSIESLELIASIRLDQDRRAEARAVYREIVERNPRSWVAWVHLADVSSGAERRRAVAVVQALNPRFRGLEGSS